MLNQDAAVVTGASAGIGAACAVELAKRGFVPIMLARREAELSALTDKINRLNISECYAFPGDVTDCDTPDSLFDFISKRQLKLKVIVNNAGGSSVNLPMEDLSDEDWQQAFELNVFSVVRLVNRLLPLFDKDTGGRIINVASINAKVPGRYNPHYCAAKSALTCYTKYLSNYLAKKNIRVNSVSPGIIETEGWYKHMSNSAKQMNQDFDEYLRELKSDLSEIIPVGRVGTSYEVASLVGFLTSPEADYINGSDFVIDGGKRREL